jgi:hypothetical protein
MREISRARNAWLSVAGLGLLAAVVRILIQPSTPLPRWDLLVCLALASVGVGGGLACIRRGPFPEPGGAGMRRYWWPDQRSSWMGSGLLAGLVPVFLVAYAATSYSPEAWRIVEAGHTIRAVEVQKVLASKYVKSNKHTGHYATEIVVSVPFDGGREPVEGQIRSDTPVERGDRAWALYAPSSAGLGAVVDEDRDALRAKIGGSAEAPLSIMVLGWTAFCLFLAVGGGGVAGAPRKIGPVLKAGRARSLLVTVTGGGVALDRRPPKGSESNRPKPRLQLEGVDGELLDLFMDRAVDPVSVARCVTGSQAKLYWGAQPQEQPHGASAAHAVLVLDGERYVRGWMETNDGSNLPEGSPVPAGKELPEGREVRAIRTFPIWDAALHSGGLWALLFGLVALAITTLGVGTVTTIVLAAVAYLSLVVAWGSVASRRTRYLRSLLPETAASESAS